MVSNTSFRLQRQCACGQHTEGGDCKECKKGKQQLQRRSNSASNASGPSVAPRIVHETLGGAGQPLDTSTRSFFEPRFAHDFSQVRVHTGDRAAESARAVNALAYTVGPHVVFADQQYAPHTSEGRATIAHELVHVMQQAGAASAGSLPIGSPGDSLEREADRVSAEVMGSEARASRSTNTTARLGVQRLGANPTCTKAEADGIHQAIFDARGWLNKAIPKLEAVPLAVEVTSSLRRNFGPTFGVEANASLITGRLLVALDRLGKNSFACDTAGTTPFCAAQHCGWSTVGSNSSTVCTNPTSTLDLAWPQAPACMLHETLHASLNFMTVDNYKGTAGFPGAGTDPLKNPDSYTFLVEDLS